MRIAGLSEAVAQKKLSVAKAAVVEGDKAGFGHAVAPGFLRRHTSILPQPGCLRVSSTDAQACAQADAEAGTIHCACAGWCAALLLTRQSGM